MLLSRPGAQTQVLDVKLVPKLNNAGSATCCKRRGCQSMIGHCRRGKQGKQVGREDARRDQIRGVGVSGKILKGKQQKVGN
jgi:hypothetical protein